MNRCCQQLLDPDTPQSPPSGTFEAVSCASGKRSLHQVLTLTNIFLCLFGFALCEHGIQLRPQCTRSKTGRSVKRHRRQDELDAMLGLNHDNRAITYCGGGVAASSSAFVMTRLGFTDVAVYMGSLEEWAADWDLPLENDSL